MAYLLTNALQNMWRSLGQLTTDVATGGTALTAIETNLGSDKYDDDFCVGGTLVVIRDAGGAGADPEGKYGIITAYDQTNQIFTFTPTVTTPIAAGDTFGWASALFPLYDSVEIMNQALRDLGPVPNIDTSVTGIATVTEYTLPAAITSRPIYVEQLIGKDYQELGKWDVVPSAIGSAWKLRIPYFNNSTTLRIWYLAVHPYLNLYSSEISPYIPQPLVDAAALAWACQWFNRRIGGGNDYWLATEKIAWADYERAKTEHRIMYPKRSNRSISLDS
jgi:hypothetical protein